MSVRLWSTLAPVEPSFESDWRDRLSRCPHAHFGFDPAYLADEARHGRHALAVLSDDGGRRGVLVLRESGPELISGWPWRWHALVENSRDPTASGMSADEAEWLWSQAQRLAAGRRLRFHLPAGVSNGAPWFVAGSTYLQPLEHPEDEIWKSMDGAKRRMVKRAVSQGYRVVEARDVELLRAFGRLPRDARHSPPAVETADPPAPGEGYREWERPWMWLLVAVRDGVVEAGSGFGLCPGATIDYRTNASTPAGKKDGANVLLAWEAIRLGRERGYRWLNWGGATRFKQEFGGQRIEVACRLGGGPVWLVPNLMDASARRARVGLGEWRRRVRRAAAARQASEPKRAHRPRKHEGPRCWRTRQPRDPEFDRTWEEFLTRAPLTHFGFDLRYLAWEARHGRHSMAVLAEHEGRRGAMVLRETRSGWACGWAWRWLAAVADPAGQRSPHLAPADATWLFRQAVRLAKGGRVRFYLPVPPPPGVTGYEVGATIVQALDRTDDELVASMHASKRRMLRRAQQEGYRVIEGASLEHFRTFAAIQQETFQRRGIRVPRPREGVPEPGEDWREWELPWMWLLLAERAGRIESGLGDGISPGGMLEGRTGASTAAGRRAGAFALLCYEEARRGRDRGYRWLNHGGDTPFKREIAGSLGTRLPMHCWLGGDPRWLLPNRSESWAWGMRLGVPAWLRAVRARAKDRS